MADYGLVRAPGETLLRQKMPDVVTMPQLYREAGGQAHAFGKIFHLGGRNAAQRAQWEKTLVPLQNKAMIDFEKQGIPQAREIYIAMQREVAKVERT